MTSENFPLIPDSSRRPLTTTRHTAASGMYNIIRDAIPLPLVLAAGALLGSCFTTLLSCFGFNYVVSFGIIGLVLVSYPISAYLTHLGFCKNAHMHGVIPGTTTGRIPGNVEGVGCPEFCVVLIMARCNGALGLFDPDFKWVVKSFAAMVKDLEGSPDSGLMNIESYRSTRRRNNNGSLTVLYFKSSDYVHKWAKTGLHNSAWMTVARSPEKYGHIELAHELFTIKQGGFESVYVNGDSHGAGELYEFFPDDEEMHSTSNRGVWKSTLGRVAKGSESYGRMKGQ